MKYRKARTLLLSLALATTLLFTGCGQVADSTSSSETTSVIETTSENSLEGVTEQANETTETDSSHLEEIMESVSKKQSEEASKKEAESASIEESAKESAKQSEEDSIAESEAASKAEQESLEASIAESQSIEASIAESQSIEASIAESIKAEEPVPTTTAPPVTSGIDTVIIGDSRTSDFYWYSVLPGRYGSYYDAKMYPDGCMDNNRVYYLGGCLEYLYDQVAEAAALQPRNVIFMCGQNELGYYSGNAAAFTEQYVKLIQSFVAVSPNTNIYVTTIIPCNEVGIAEVPNRIHVGEYNEALYAMCATYGWDCFDASAGFDPSYYVYDGVHFVYAWYPIWLNNMRQHVGF